MHGLDIGDVAYSACYTRLSCLAPIAVQGWASPKERQLVNTATTQTPLPYIPLPPFQSASGYPQNVCFFCGGAHVMRACPTAGEYLRAGRIIRDGPYFAYPDRSRIRRIGNDTFKQTIDARYTSGQPAPPATGANAIPVESTCHETSTEIPSSAFISESYFLQCELVVENHAVIVNVEDSSDEESNYLLDVNAVTRSKAKASSSTTPETDPASDTTKAPPSVETKKPPAFTYESKAASPDAVQRVFKGILEVTVPNITIADLFAISPEL